MNLLQQSLSGGAMIMAIVIIRALCIHHLPKRLLTAFWSLPLLRLLIPYSFPFSGSVFTLLARRPSAAYQPVQTTAAPVAFTAVPTVMQTAVPMEAFPVAWWSILYWVGVAVFSAYFLTVYIKSLREFRTAPPVHSVHAQRFLQENPLRRRVSIRQSDRIAAPLSYGVFRPVILLPSITDWSDEASLRYVLTHEMTHIRSLDAVIKLILTAALCVHWFNPLVWVMNILANRDIELSCDAAVLRQVGWQSRSDYALTLISMEERKSSLTPLGSGFSKNAIEERITAMMKFKRTSITALMIALILMLGVSAAFATTAAPNTQAKPYSSSASKSSGSVTSTEGSLHSGMNGYEVRKLQEQLKKLGYLSEITGLYDDATIDAVKSFQKQNNLYEDGVAGPATQRMIFGTDSADTSSTQPPADWTMRQEAPEGWQKDQAAQPVQLSPEEMLALYGSYGISYDAQGNLLYQGEKVRYFCDGVGTGEGEWFVRHDFFNKDGTVDVYTQRAFVDNGDGSVNPFGPLAGLRRATYDEFENLNIVTTTEETVVVEAVADVFTASDSDRGETLADRFSRYAEYGVVFDEEGKGSISFHGEAVRSFVDIQPDGGVFTYSAPDGNGLSVCTVYDSQGVLVGVEVVE